MTILRAALAGCRTFSHAFNRWRYVAFGRAVLIEVVHERPEHLRQRRLYVTQAGQDAVFGVMICPCGCQETLNLRFLPDRRPRWYLEGEAGERATVRPSIWRREGCRSHFFLTDGRIIWCQ